MDMEKLKGQMKVGLTRHKLKSRFEKEQKRPECGGRGFP